MNLNRVSIAGAGLVGSLTAILLQRKGIQVTVYEKRQDPRLTKEDGKSINLVLTSKGLKPLDTLQLRKEVLELAVPVSGRMIHNLNNSEYYQPYGRTKEECNYSVSRSNLNQLLIGLAEKEGVRFLFDNGIDSVDINAKTIRLKNKSNVSYEYLIGTDGLGSQVRKSISSKFNSRDLIEPLDCYYKELTMPPSIEGNFKINGTALHIWPHGNHMLMALPNRDHSFTLTLYNPVSGTVSLDHISKTDSIEAYFRNFFPEIPELVPDFLDQFKTNPEGKLGTVHCDRWTDGASVLLMGDAAHGIVPFFGQGMNSGFDDCQTLNCLLDSEPNWASLLQKFETSQKPRGNSIARMAIENYYEMSEKVGNTSFLKRKAIENRIEKEFPRDFLSRYSMVTHTLIPYDICEKAGLIIDEILDKLQADLKSDDISNLNLELAKELISCHLGPFFKENEITTDLYF